MPATRAAAAPLARHVFETMGTTVSLAVVGEVPEGALAAVERVFAEHDRRFSLYRPESEATAVGHGRMPLEVASQAFRDAAGLAESWRRSTDGAFDPVRPDGVLDLSGVVKAIAIRDAGRALRARGLHDWCLNAGGDVLVEGRAPGGSPWAIGVVHPRDRQRLLTLARCEGARRAVATSGVTERGEHVWRTDALDAGGPLPDEALVQVTVVADDILTADVLATAILAGGRAALDRELRRHDVEAVACTASGGILATAGFRA